uniref:Uncharacterized protein n=1 Tax=Arundo donax TaxID=35708 RepID=A0A0A9BQC3_ARUDO
MYILCGCKMEGQIDTFTEGTRTISKCLREELHQ